MFSVHIQVHGITIFGQNAGGACDQIRTGYLTAGVFRIARPIHPDNIRGRWVFHDACSLLLIVKTDIVDYA